jgi:3-phenylpropionate/trans-cinnamate dioxygenase ferredoxin subunit
VNGWLTVDVAGLAPGETRALELAGRHVLVCHAEGGYFALENRCPHAATPLTRGRLRGFVLECPLHGGKLDVRDGRPCAPPIRSPANTFAVRPVAGGIEIRLDGLRSPSARCAGAD